MLQPVVSSGNAASLSEAVGVTMYSSDLYMPNYLDGQIGRWRLTRTGFCLDRGYYSGLWGVQGMSVLMRDSSGAADSATWETWMSLSPHEIESQELGCRYAFGHTVVMGLGMGWVAVNCALNAAVHKVTIIERDPDVIELFRTSGALDGLAADVTVKIRIVQDDALTWLPDEAVDFLYADIWRCLEEPQTLDDVRQMQSHVQAGTIYFWGQELLIHALATNEGGSCSGNGWGATVRHCVHNTVRLPLLLPSEFDYPERIAAVARLRSARGTSCKAAQ